MMGKATCSGLRGVSASNCARPRTALSGVRISCDMVARNCDLAELAACACGCGWRARVRK